MQQLAFLFPGQGSQAVGMGAELAATSPAAAAVWSAADEAIGEPLSRIAWDGPAERLNETANAQPALLAASIALLAALGERCFELGTEAPRPAFAAGHSMGQYSAMVAAGVLDLPEGIRLVRRRGELMQSSGQGRDGAMAAVIGLDDEQLPALVERASAHGIFALANRNAPGQVVVSGDRAAIDASVEIARSLGARKVVVLPVSVAAHSPLMADAANELRDVLREVDLRDPVTTLIANADARALTTAEDCRTELVEHLTAGVDWVAAVGLMERAGVTTFAEVGPGRVLGGLTRRIAPDADVISVDDAEAFEHLAATPPTAAAI
jgi:[acyl-carrier-protein] S-malonyltransferase